MKIDGSVCLVTGGARGLGRIIADQLYNQGATVIVVDRNMSTSKNLPKGMFSYCFDVTNIEDAKSTVRSIFVDHGPINILVNNAGLISSEPFVNLFSETIMHDYDHFREIIVGNLDATFIMTSVLVAQMVQNQISGVVINISSICAKGNEGQTAYSAAKAGVNAMTMTWAKELSKFGIRCNAVSPGFIDTQSTHDALNKHSIAKIKQNIPLGCLGTPMDVAKAISFIVENDLINGSVIDVNGGLKL